MRRSKTPSRYSLGTSHGRRLAAITLLVVITAVAAAAALTGATRPILGTGFTTACLAALVLFLVIPATCLAFSVVRTASSSGDGIEKVARARIILNAITAIFNEKAGSMASQALLRLRIFDAFYTTKPVGQGTGWGSASPPTSSCTDTVAGSRWKASPARGHVSASSCR